MCEGKPLNFCRRRLAEPKALDVVDVICSFIKLIIRMINSEVFTVTGITSPSKPSQPSE